MRWNLRVGQVNAVLVALYFIRVWGVEGLRTLLSPVFGLSDRVNLATALFYNGLFDLGPNGLARAASILAGLKLLAGALFVAYVIDVARGLAIGRESDRSTLDGALLLATAVVILSAVPGYASGGPEVVRLYATQFLLVMGAVIVTVVDQAPQLAPSKLTRGQLARTLHEAQVKPALGTPDASGRLLNVLTFERLRQPEQTPS